jgi:hypothetical protein
LPKIGLHFGQYFFKSSSGHPAREQRNNSIKSKTNIIPTCMYTQSPVQQSLNHL